MNCSSGFEWNRYCNRADAYSTSRSPFWFKSLLSSRSSTSVRVIVWWSISLFNITTVLFSRHNKVLNWRYWHLLIVLGYHPHGWWWGRVIARSCWEVWRTPYQVTIKVALSCSRKDTKLLNPSPPPPSPPSLFPLKNYPTFLKFWVLGHPSSLDICSCFLLDLGYGSPHC